MNKDFELTLLSEGQIWGNNKERQLDVIIKYGTKAAITDLCVLTGSYLCENTKYNIDEDRSLTGRTSWFWTRTDDGDNDVRVVNKYGSTRDGLFRYARNGAVRPALQSSVIFSQISTSRVSGYNGTEEVEFGEYPQNAADSRMQNILESEYNRGMNKTGRSYTFDSVKYIDSDTGFKPVTYEEYEYQGKKYIRIKANSDFCGDKFILSNGACYKDGDYVWVEVSPVKWLIDDENNQLISKKGLVSGIRFLDRNHNYHGDFSKTEMYEYLNKYMIKDLFQNVNCIQKGSDNNIEESLNILGLGSCKGISQEILNLIVKDRINQVITDSKLYDSMDYKLLKEQINKILEAGKSISLHVNNISNKVKQLNSK